MRPLEDYPDAHLRVFERPDPPPPEQVERPYLIGVCGKGMGALAEILAEAGYAVSGSDEAAYPPMSTRLASASVEVLEGYDPAHLGDPDAPDAPDLIVVGNACTPTHPEATRAREERRVQLSLPEAVAHFLIRDRRSLVVAGTHGKTTTTGLLAHVFRHAGLNPGFLVGGVLAGDDRTGAPGGGPHFIVEGDEYDAAYFDKRPKMLLYRPTSAVVTSLEFDHADLYADWDAYRDAFRAFVRLVPDDGLLALNAHDPDVLELRALASARVQTYGIDTDADVRAESLKAEAGGQTFTLRFRDRDLGTVRLPMPGRYNVLNALAVSALALDEGIGPDALVAALEAFPGMERRQEVKGEAAGVLVIDDFAHHPTAVELTLKGLRAQYPGRRIVAAFEPRSNSSRRKLFEDRYADALRHADAVFLSVPPLRHNDDPADFIDADAVATRIQTEGGPTARVFPDPDALFGPLVESLESGDLALVMSNGSFGGLPGRIVEALKEREAN